MALRDFTILWVVLVGAGDTIFLLVRSSRLAKLAPEHSAGRGKVVQHVVLVILYGPLTV